MDEIMKKKDNKPTGQTYGRKCCAVYLFLFFEYANGLSSIGGAVDRFCSVQYLLNFPQRRD